MTLEITIDKMDGAAFVDSGPWQEAARILRDAADKIERGQTDCALFDINGNKVGRLSFDTVV